MGPKFPVHDLCGRVMVWGRAGALLQRLPWVAAVTIDWLQNALKKKVAKNKLQCVVSSAKLARDLKAPMSSVGVIPALGGGKPWH